MLIQPENTTETIEVPLNGEKIFKDKAIYLGAYLGGPLVAGYIIAMNFKAFGDIRKYKTTIVITILVTLAIYALVFSIPDDVRISNHVIPFTYTIISFFILRWTQGKNIDSHIKAGGLVYSWGRVFLVGFIGLLVTVLFALPFIFFPFSEENPEVYLHEYKHGINEISYRSREIEKDEVKMICDKLTKASFFDSIPTYLSVSKSYKVYEIYIPLLTPYWEKQEIVAYYDNIISEMKLNNEGKKYKIILCDSAYNIKREIE